MEMAAVGVLHEDDKVELLDGVLVDLNPIGADHSAAVARLTRHLVLLRIEGGFVLPDLMVVDPVEPGRHPETARLVVEVAFTPIQRRAGTRTSGGCLQAARFNRHSSLNR